MFARVAFVTCFALLFIEPVTNGEKASRGIENRPAVSNTVSKAQSMAQRELEIGRYYMSRGNYPGAINRFKIVLERFPSTSVVDEALFRLVQACLAIGIHNEAQTAAGALNRKFSQSHWRSDALEILQKAGLEPVDDEASWIIHAFQ